MGPVFDLMTFEQSLTGNDSAEAVITHLCKFNFVGFWSDMAIILAAKHMRDLGARSEARDLLATRLHESYRFFTRRG
jgi:hypothetical protein